MLIEAQDHGYPPEDYAAYLPSALWREIKARVLDRDGRKCFFCRGAAAVVHHRSYAPEVMNGTADHLLVSLCNVCHAHIHFDQAGAWLSPQVTDALLLTRAGQQDFPQPHFNPRIRFAANLPREWRTMNSAQQAGWKAQFAKMQAEYLQAKRDRDQATAVRKASRPPIEPGWTRLEDAVAKHRAELVNSYGWYQHDARTRGSIRVGQREVPAEKRRRAWCVRTADLIQAIEHVRRMPQDFVVMGMQPADH